MATQDTTVFLSRNASSALGIFSKASKATATVPQQDSSPTDGQSIPIILGAVRMTGSVIWIRTFLNSKNECRAHIAVCFGRNAFGRPLALAAVTQGESYIYKRTGGDVVDPPSAVRFYDGTQTTADPKIVSYEGAARTPAFKGYIYAVLENVKVGDFGFGSEFTDEAVEEPVEAGGSNTISCNNELDGLNLVYNFETKMFYGIRNPLTFEATLVRSKDGCRVFDETELPTESQAPADEPTPDLIGHYDYVFPIRCLPMVVWPISGVWVHSFGADPQYRPLSVGYLYSGTSTGYYSLGYYDQNGPNSHYNIPYPLGSTPHEFVESYPLPGSSTRYSLLRLYDRNDYVNGTFGYNNPGTGNISCTILDTAMGFQTGNPTLIVTGDEASQSRNPNRSTDSVTYEDTWDVVGSPLVDEVFYGSADGSIVRLGGIKLNGNTVTVFRIEHSAFGMTYPFTINIGLPAGLEYSGAQYVRGTDKILVSVTASLPETFLSSRVYKINLQGEVSYATLPSNIRMFSRKKSQEYNGLVAMTNEDGSEIYTFNSETDELLPIYSGDVPTDDPVVDLSRNTVSIPTVNGYSTYTVSQITPGNIPLTTLLTDCCALKGYDPADIVFENLEADSVKGLLISSTIRLTDLFRRLGSLYSFTFAETDGKLKFVKKRTVSGLSIDVSLTKNDLMLLDGEDAYVRVSERNGANNLLGGMDLEFINPNKNYETSTIKIRRPTGSFDTGASERLETLSVPVTLDTSYAYRLMYESFYTTLQRQSRVSFGVPSWGARIEPGDCVQVTVDGIVTTGVAMRVVMRADFAQEVELDVFLADGTTDISDVVDYVPVPPVDAITPMYISMELPFLRSSDYTGSSSSILYHCITADDVGGWAWADLYNSRDGTTFSKTADYDSPPMTVARSLNSVAYAELEFALDEENTITIEVLSGNASDFMSVTYLQQMNGANLCALSTNYYLGSWEVLSFQTVTENSDGTLTLSGLQRGLFGSHAYFLYEQFGVASVLHEAGATLVLLDPFKIFGTPYPVSDKGRADWFAIKTVGHELSESKAGPFRFQNYAMRWCEPAALTGIHLAGSNDFVISWEPVSCVPCEWPDNGGVSLMHATLRYDITLNTQNGNFSFTTTDRTYTWTGYGDEFGATASAEVVIQGIRVTPYNESLGYGNMAYALAQEI